MIALHSKAPLRLFKEDATFPYGEFRGRFFFAPQMLGMRVVSVYAPGFACLHEFLTAEKDGNQNYVDLYRRCGNLDYPAYKNH